MRGWGPGRAMRYLPQAVAEPELGSPGRFLWWMAGRFAVQTVWGVGLGVLTLLAQALVPGAIGLAVDRGIAGRDQGQLLLWGGAVLVLGLVVNTAAILRDRCSMIANYGAVFLGTELITRQSARLGAALTRRVSTGEVVGVGVADLRAVGRLLEVVTRASGAAVSSAVVALIMLVTAPWLGLLVLAGVPLMAWAVALLIRPLHRRQEGLRAQQGGLTELAVDIAGGLRVLRGIGGEPLFLARYRRDSQAVRAAGVRLARIEALLDGTKVLLPGILVALVVWLGAAEVLDHRLTMGQLIAFYGYAVFLAPQLQRLTEAVDKLTRARVAARRVVRLLALAPDLAAGDAVAPEGGLLADPDSGLRLRPGGLTAVACADPVAAGALADRLGRYTDGGTTLGGVPLAELPLDEVRRRILVLPGDARLFSGPLRGELDPRGRGDAALTAALTAAAALDVVEALPGGLDGEIVDGGREFSGGQQQRLRLARALLADPEVLVLVEPTSAVDAHTEARIADRLRTARTGRTTLVLATSPVLLARADHVVLLVDGKAVAEGSHRELLADPGYRAVVTRGGDDA
ncbi:ABC transporter transmembrane domain-containing protein [Kitasatospora sp. NPDC058965]|uniref:ABC transporter transmembrane domain-containing protein n=1 Tax=Kitasatospora sp. NPDC058965 TaxID=3346682 RepID=UPI00367815A7